MGKGIQSDTLELEKRNCPFCDDDRPLLIYGDGLIPSVSKKNTNGLYLNECSGCGTLYVNPAPSRDVLMEFYNSDYYSSDERKVVKMFQKINSLKSNLSKWGIRVRKMKAADQNTRVLEIGCANGNNLLPYLDSGWQVYAIEPNHRLATVAESHGVSVQSGFLSANVFGEMKFDVVILSHVLEHEHEPHEMIKLISNLLKEDGLLYLEVPNIESLSRFLFRKYWGEYEFPLHLSLLSESCIMSLLQQSGLTPLGVHYVNLLGDAHRALSKRLALGRTRGNRILGLVELLIASSAQAVIVFLNSVFQRGDAFAITAKRN